MGYYQITLYICRSIFVNIDRLGLWEYTIIESILNLPLGHFSSLCQKIVDVFIVYNTLEAAVS